MLRLSSRCRISGFHSGTFGPRYAIDCRDEFCPAASLRSQNLAAVASQFVETAAALPRLFNPAALNPSTLLKAVQQRIERRYVELQHAVGTRLDQLADFVTVPRPCFNQGKNQ